MAATTVNVNPFFLVAFDISFLENKERCGLISLSQ